MNNKTLHLDTITAKLMKTNNLSSNHTTFLNTYLAKKVFPGDWRKTIIVKISKEGNLTDYNNWGGICLLSIPGKILSAMILNRLKTIVNAKLREEQTGFRAARLHTEQLFTLRNIIYVYKIPKTLFFNFIEFKKEFSYGISMEDSKNVWYTWWIHQFIQKQLPEFHLLHRNRVRYHWFFSLSKTGVKQGCIILKKMN